MTHCIRCNGTGTLIAAETRFTCSACIPGMRYAAFLPDDKLDDAVQAQLASLAMRMALRGMVLRARQAGAFVQGCKAVGGRYIVRCSDDWALRGDWGDDPVSLVVTYGVPVTAPDGVPVYDVAQLAYVAALEGWLG